MTTSAPAALTTMPATATGPAWLSPARSVSVAARSPRSRRPGTGSSGGRVTIGPPTTAMPTAGAECGRFGHRVDDGVDLVEDHVETGPALGSGRTRRRRPGQPARLGRTGASRPVLPVPGKVPRSPLVSWYSSSTLTDQMSWRAPWMFSTVSIAVYIE